MSDASTKKIPEPVEPSAESLAEMPEIDPSKLRRRPGRGHHAPLQGGELLLAALTLGKRMPDGVYERTRRRCSMPSRG